MAALVAGALAQAGDRPASLAAVLADRYRRPGVVIAAAALALIAAGLLASAGGALLASRLTPEAKRLLLALALLLQGAGGLFRPKSLDRLEGWRLPVFATSFLGLFILFFGDGLQFVVLALAAGSTLPYAAAVGATLGALAVIAPAAVMGEAGWRGLPQSALRRTASALFLVAGLWTGLAGFGLV